MHRLILILAVFALAACGPRAKEVTVMETGGIGAEVPVFVATSRDIEPDGGLSNLRSPSVNYLRFDVSVPPDREKGSLPLPAHEPDPSRHFVAEAREDYDGAGPFLTDLRAQLAAAPKGRRIVVVYVHGFNNTFPEGMFRIAQLSHDLNLPGVPVNFAWPSAAHPLGYAHDRDSVLAARSGLEGLLETLDRAGADQVLVVAHSMGSMLTMETLRQMDLRQRGRAARIVDSVFLMAPDIDVEVFRSQVATIDPLPEPFGIFVSNRDRILALSSRINYNRGPRLGNLTDVSEIADLNVTVFDVSSFSRRDGHLTAVQSPGLLEIFGQAAQLDEAFQSERSGRIGLIPGTIVSIQNLTKVVIPASVVGESLGR